MKLTPEIIPGKSLGGILLNTSVDQVISKFSSDYTVDFSDNIVTLDAGLITIGHDENRLIYSVMCNSKFKGSYLDKLWAGMTVRDVLKHSSTQIAWGGAVVVDGIEGIGLPLPDGFDDFDQLTDYLQLDHVFEHLSVFLI
ncbi:hypothetical protein ABIC94_000787 [Variovorax paradoxus]|uniref:hypothetical protein n=1 Tax=Variovorax paradoxus TaxID=34073 RepID=UPI003397AF19